MGPACPTDQTPGPKEFGPKARALWGGTGRVPKTLPGGSSNEPNPAALRAKINLKLFYTTDPGRNRPTTTDFLKNMLIRTLPRTPPRGRGDKNKIKHVLEYSWAKGGGEGMARGEGQKGSPTGNPL